jgi:hypothetical protein
MSKTTQKEQPKGAKTGTKTKAEEAKSEDVTKPGRTGDGSFDHTPTAPQVQTTAPSVITSSADGVDTKSVRHDKQPGAGEPTTIVEEARILDPDSIDSDLDKQIATMSVLAQSQGVNQVAVLGQKKKDGKQHDEVLTVFQDGSHSIDLVPVFDKDPD